MRCGQTTIVLLAVGFVEAQHRAYGIVRRINASGHDRRKPRRVVATALPAPEHGSALLLRRERLLDVSTPAFHRAHSIRERTAERHRLLEDQRFSAV
jgi:hypothetical protein